MRILLTGITGFVGQNLMPKLLDSCKNDEFLTLNHDIQKANVMYPKQIYTNFSHVSAYNFNDVLEFNPEIVLHLATMTTSKNDSELICPMIQANIEFGTLLLSFLSKCPDFKLFVNTGSFAEFRLGEGIFNNAYLYSASKTAFRAFLDYYSDYANFKYINAIPYSVYGGKMTVKRLIDYIYESMDSQIPVNMTKGEQVLDFIHVDDIADFYIDVIKNRNKYLDSSINNGENFHLGTGRGTSVRELVSIVEKKYNKKCNINWGALAYRERDIMHAVAPIGKNKVLGGWTAKISLEEGC